MHCFERPPLCGWPCHAGVPADASRLTGLMTTHLTRYEQFQRRIGVQLTQALTGSWRRRSLGVLSLLLGFLLGSNFTMYWFQRVGQRPFVVLTMVIVIELLVRARTYVKREPWPIGWLAIDNIRIGAVFSVVFEAFKLGS